MKKVEARKIFHSEIEFLIGAHNVSQIPKHHYPEIAFIGASNVGKSSLINAVFAKKIAIVSSTPGRTRQLNFFKIAGFRDGFMMVDMPGYGFAKAKVEKIQHWQDVSFDYLMNRPNLKRIFLLIDATKGLKNHDLEVISIFTQNNIFFQIVLTKIDKLNLEDQEKSSQEIVKKLEAFPSFCSKIIKTSSSKKYGIEDLQNSIVEVLNNL